MPAFGPGGEWLPSPAEETTKYTVVDGIPEVKPVYVPTDIVAWNNPFSGETDPQMLKMYDDFSMRQASLNFGQGQPERVKLQAHDPPSMGGGFRDVPAITTQTGASLLNDLSTVFGEGARLGNSNLVDEGLGDAKHPIREMSLSHAQRGKYTQLGDVIVYYMRIEPSIWTGPGGVLPYQLTNDPKLQWDTVEYLPQMVDPTPELAPARTLAFRRKTHTSGFQRYALAIRNTTDYVKSEEGQIGMARQVRHMAITIQEFNAFSVLYALNEADEVYKQYIRRIVGHKNAGSNLELMNFEKFLWDRMKKKLGINQLDAQIRELMQVFGGSADTWIITAQQAIYMGLNIERNTNASEVGVQMALSNAEDSINSMQRFNLGNVIVSRAFAVGVKASQHPHQFHAMIGEHADMYNVLDKMDYEQFSLTDLVNRAQTVEVFDESNKTQAQITLQMAIENCEIFDADGAPNNNMAARYKNSKPSNFGKEAFRTEKVRATRGTAEAWIPKNLVDGSGVFFPTLGPYLVSACFGQPQRARMFASSFIQALKRLAETYNAEWPIVNQELAWYGSRPEGDPPAFPTATVEGGAYVSQVTAGVVTGGQQESSQLYRMLNLVANGTYDVTFSNEATDSTQVNAISTADRRFPTGADRVAKDGMEAAFQEILRRASPQDKAALRFMAAIPFSRMNLLGLHNQGIAIPVAFTVRRPHMTYGTQAAYKLKRGPETGNTFLKPGIFSMAEDANIQEVAGMYSYKVKALVKEPKNVFAARNVYANKYIGGANIKPIRKPAPSSKERYAPMQNYYGVGHIPLGRSGGRAPDPLRPSIYFFMEPYHWVNKPDRSPTYSIHNKLYVHYGGNPLAVAMNESLVDVSSPMTDWYRVYWEFDGKILPSINPYETNITLLQHHVPMNGTTHRGPTRHWNPFTKEFGTENYTEPGQGHWGPVIRIDEAAIRVGESRSED